MRIRFQADNDLDQRIVAATLRLNSSIDFRTAPDAKLHNRSDTEVLAIAARAGRVLVSRDRRTMPKHFFDFIRDASSPGLIIISRQVTVGQAAEWLHLLWEASDAEEYANIIYSLP